MSSYFTKVITCIDAHEGDVVKFAGVQDLEVDDMASMRSSPKTCCAMPCFVTLSLTLQGIP